MSARDIREKLKVLLSEYETARVSLMAHLEQAEAFVDQANTIRVRSIHKIIQTKKGEFSVANKTFESFFKENDTEEVKLNDTRVQFDSDKATLVLTMIDEYLESVAKKNDQQSVEKVHYTQALHDLPSLELLKFDGKDKSFFPTFWDNFISTIDTRPDISASSKFSYLRRSLEGDAFRVIKSLLTTQENYEVAKQLLEEEFGNSGDLTSFFYDRLLELKPHSESVEGLKNYYYDIKNHVSSLKCQKFPVKTCLSLQLCTL